jgi:serine/threonine-protein kinase
MGTVFKIEHQITKRLEAMKILPGGWSADPAQVQRFEREIQVQARLHHPNIAALYTAVRDGSSIVLVMEYVEGESLERMLEAGPLPIPTALDFILQVLSALSYAHSCGVIHRDVAPANIIITRDRCAKLTDFGLARTSTDLRLTNSGAPLGSPWYMSPEQVRNVDAVDFRTDLYSTAAVLYEMITGSKLYEADSAFSVMRAHVETVPAAPSSRNSAISPALDGVILRALSKDPELRFQSADEFRQAIDLVHSERTEIIPPPVAPLAPQKSRRRQIAAMMVGPVLFAAGFAAVALTRTPKRKPSPHPTPVVSSAPAPEPVPAPVPEVAPSETPAEPPAAPPASAQVARAPRRPTKPAAAPGPRYAIRVSGGEVQPTTTTQHTAVHTLPAAPAQAQADGLPEPPAPEPAAVPPAEAPLPAAADAAPATPQKPGNRFVRALGKINPFRKKNQQ